MYACTITYTGQVIFDKVPEKTTPCLSGRVVISFEVYLTGIMALLAAGAEAAGRQDEDLLRDAVDLPHALVVVDDRNLRLTDPQRDRSS